MDFYSWIGFEYLLRLLRVLCMQVNAYNLGVVGLELINNFFEWGAGATSYIEEVSLEHGHVIDHLHVGDDGEECADEEVVDENWQFFDKSEHYSGVF